MTPTDFASLLPNASEEYNYGFPSSLDDYPDFSDLFCEKSHVRKFASRFLPPLYWLAFTVGALGNSLVILVYCYCTRAKTVTDMFLLNLTMADLLFLLTLPFWASAAADQWTFSGFVCKVVNSTYKVNFYSCVLLITCISVDRYIVITQAMKAQMWRRKRLLYSKMVCVTIWVGAVVLCTPEMLYSQVTWKSNVSACTMVYPSNLSTRVKSSVLTLKVILGFLCPLGVMVFCYTIIIHTLLRAKRSSKHKALRVIVAVLTAFTAEPFFLVATSLVSTPKPVQPLSTTQASTGRRRGQGAEQEGYRLGMEGSLSQTEGPGSLATDRIGCPDAVEPGPLH
ncbi:C-C chemokine receptor type 9 [Echinops telfairi]|uniref:C-C chemokine receptor type 9 n=1 Tax=Echinops telfairi TaxID=9371 RepID=A0ABM0ZQQ7_ECHTE|nr:C-C chemokine receptor type 9 [Echinops telfairi]